MNKRKFSLLLFLCFYLGTWANGVEINEICYILNQEEGTASVTFTGSTKDDPNTYKGSISIPSVVSYNGKDYKVTSIGEHAFRLCKELTSVVLPISIKRIEYNAFSACTALSNITMPRVTSIGYSAFWYCESLKSISLSSVTSLGELAFAYCSGLTSITIGGSLDDIGKNAFIGCSRIESISIYNKAFLSSAFSSDYNISTIFGNKIKECLIGIDVTSIGDFAFKGCSNMTSITFPGNIKSIGSNAFQDCSSLTSISFPKSLDSIGNNAFNGCSKLESISLYNNKMLSSNYSSDYNLSTIFGSQLKECVIGDEVTSIGNYALKGCSGLSIITLPEAITTIGNNAFENCRSLTSINIPKSVKTIGNDAFQGCSGLESVSLYSKALFTLISYSSEYNFSAIFGSQVKEYVLGDEVTRIGNYAFKGCSSLVNISIPESIKTIGNYAFQDCSSLTGIAIPKSVTSIGIRAFGNCSKLTKMEVEADNTIYDSRDNCNAIIETSSNTLLAGCQNTTIPSTINSIGGYAFDGCIGLRNITIPQSVRNIGRGAFYGCINLKEVYMPDEISTIGVNAFYYTNDNQTSILNVQFYTKRGSTTLLTLWSSDYSSNPIFDIDNKKRIIKPALKLVTVTQSTATLLFQMNENSQYNYRIENEDVYASNRYTLSNLKPQSSSNATLYATCKDKDNWHPIASCNFTTRDISPIVSGNATVSTVTLTPSYTIGDADVTSQIITFDGKTQNVEAGKTYTFTGLDPNKSYLMTYTIIANDYTITYNDTLTTLIPVMETKQPKVISIGKVVVAADTNFDEPEKTFIGFEWRRTDWTDDFSSNRCNAYLYDNTMEGFISDLNTDKLWKYRPYYETADGTSYYGEWVGIDPTNTGYYEPTVHTYASISVNGNSVELKGYAMRGTDNIQQQGFKYWTTSSATRSLYEGSMRITDLDIPANVRTVTADGQVMTAILNELDYNCDYCCVAFITTSKNVTFYGQIQTFHTDENVTGIDNTIFLETLETNHTQSQIESYYDLQGQRLIQPQKGQIVIIRHRDGTSKKKVFR